MQSVSCLTSSALIYNDWTCDTSQSNPHCLYVELVCMGLVILELVYPFSFAFLNFASVPNWTLRLVWGNLHGFICQSIKCHFWGLKSWLAAKSYKQKLHYIKRLQKYIKKIKPRGGNDKKKKSHSPPPWCYNLVLFSQGQSLYFPTTQHSTTPLDYTKLFFFSYLQSFFNCKITAFARLAKGLS